MQLSYHDPGLDARVKLMQEVVRVIRSMKQDYLPAKAKPEVHLLCQTPEAHDILTQFVGVVSTLSQCSKSAPHTHTHTRTLIPINAHLIEIVSLSG